MTIRAWEHPNVSAMTVDLTREAITEYLDDAIRLWRKRRDEAKFPEPLTLAVCYVDAFQSVRVSLLGSELPE